jgi:transposase
MIDGDAPVSTRHRGRHRTHWSTRNLSAHKTKAVQAFLDEHRNAHMHYTPTYSSRLNQVELWFGKIDGNMLIQVDDLVHNHLLRATRC